METYGVGLLIVCSYALSHFSEMEYLKCSLVLFELAKAITCVSCSWNVVIFTRLLLQVYNCH